MKYVISVIDEINVFEIKITSLGGVVFLALLLRKKSVKNNSKIFTCGIGKNSAVF